MDNIKEYKKKTILCAREIANGNFEAWNKGNRKDTWIISADVMKKTYEEIK